jgi:hypothetical protein
MQTVCCHSMHSLPPGVDKSLWLYLAMSSSHVGHDVRGKELFSHVCIMTFTDQEEACQCQTCVHPCDFVCDFMQKNKKHHAALSLGFKEERC